MFPLHGDWRCFNSTIKISIIILVGAAADWLCPRLQQPWMPGVCDTWDMLIWSALSIYNFHLDNLTQWLQCKLCACFSGLPSQAFEYIKYSNGLMTEDDYPYVGHVCNLCHPCKPSIWILFWIIYLSHFHVFPSWRTSFAISSLSWQLLLWKTLST